MIKIAIKKNEYRDSVFLMGISEKIQHVEGVHQVVIVMGTDINKTILKDLDLFSVEIQEATPHDIIIVVEAKDEEVIRRAFSEFENLIIQRASAKQNKVTYQSFEAAWNVLPDSNLALISVPGKYAAKEAKKAILKGVDVFIFSDSVPLSEEVELKKLGQQKGVLVMGPSCGASVINNVALGIMSAVEPGPIGIVGASGSGIQEIANLLNRQGVGISQAIGTGSRDLSDEVGGTTMIQGINALNSDKSTKVIILVSKPPSSKTTAKVLKVVSQCKKPIIIVFFGGNPSLIRKAGGIVASSLEEAALKAVGLIKGKDLTEETLIQTKELHSLVKSDKEKFTPQQKYLRGLFCGGTLCEEVLLLLRDYIGSIYSNIPLSPEFKLKDTNYSCRNSVIDMGTEEFTKGRPHPVIDPEIRRRRILKEGCDPEVRIILLDFILGYGAHLDPVGAVIETIAFVKKRAREEGRYLSIVGYVCGTDKDPQNRTYQEKQLKEQGVIVMPSNARAAILSGLLIS